MILGFDYQTNNFQAVPSSLSYLSYEHLRSHAKYLQTRYIPHDMDAFEASRLDQSLYMAGNLLSHQMFRTPLLFNFADPHSFFCSLFNPLLLPPTCNCTYEATKVAMTHLVCAHEANPYPLNRGNKAWKFCKKCGEWLCEHTH